MCECYLFWIYITKAKSSLGEKQLATENSLATFKTYFPKNTLKSRFNIQSIVKQCRDYDNVRNI